MQADTIEFLSIRIYRGEIVSSVEDMFFFFWSFNLDYFAPSFPHCSPS